MENLKNGELIALTTAYIECLCSERIWESKEQLSKLRGLFVQIDNVIIGNGIVCFYQPNPDYYTSIKLTNIRRIEICHICGEEKETPECFYNHAPCVPL